MSNTTTTLDQARAAHQVGDIDAAEAHCRQLLTADPQNAELWNTLGSLLDEARREVEAMECFHEAMRLRPDFAEPHNNLGLSLDRQGDEAGAIAHWQEALRLRPNWLEPQYYLSTAHAHAAPTTAPARYVAKLFDQYASTFDHHLNTLDYRAPQLLWDAVQRIGLEWAPQVIDLGCGTGLCAQKFRSISGQITGVDLSPKMIEKARERNIYDELVVGDLLEALAPRRGDVDLILAADVFGYVGELSPALTAASRAMPPGALLAFSVEKHDGGEDFILKDSRRFAHSRSYVEQLLNQLGMDIAELREEVLRKDGRNRVIGLIVIARKHGT
jgi:predicted TPR repeat methyltransferase